MSTAARRSFCDLFVPKNRAKYYSVWPGNESCAHSGAVDGYLPVNTGRRFPSDDSPS